MKKILSLIIISFSLNNLYAQLGENGIDGPTNVQLNQTYTYSIIGGFFSPAWSVTGGTIISQGTLSNGQAFEVVVKWTSPEFQSVTFTNGPFYSTSLDVFVETPAVPPPTPSLPSVSSNTCGNKTLTRGNSPSGVTWYWQTSSGGTSTGNSSANYTVSSSATVYLRARNNNDGLWSVNSRAISVTVNAYPGKPSTPSVSNNICGNKTLSRGNPPSGVIWYWQGTNANGYSGANSSSTYTVSTSGTYYIRARSAAGCWSSSRAISVLVNQAPPMPEAYPEFTKSCGSTEISWGVLPVNPNEERFWQTSASGTSTSNSSSTYTVTSSGTIYIRTRNLSGCWSPALAIPVSVDEVPSRPSAPAVSSNSCGTKTLTRGNPPSGTTWYWQTSSGGTSTDNSNSTYSMTSSGNVYLRSRNNASGCWSSTRQTTLTVIQPSTYYQDIDGDGFGNPNATIDACSQPVGYVVDNTDCNDTDATINPNTTWYIDADGDGFGVLLDPENPDLTNTSFGCEPNATGNYVTNSSDCDDSDAELNPATVWYKDLDGDGVGDPNNSQTNIDCNSAHLYDWVRTSGDCNDNDSQIQVEQNWYADLDGDGKGDPGNSILTCTPAPGYVLNDDDCDDTSASITDPTAWYLDADSDGFGTGEPVIACVAPEGYVDNNIDCNDNYADSNIDQPWYIDQDGDGYGIYFASEYDPDAPVNGDDPTEIYFTYQDTLVPAIIMSCGPPQSVAPYVRSRNDCDDENPGIGDSNIWFPDLDNDGFGDYTNPTSICGISNDYEGFVTNDQDCNDSDASITPNTIWYADTDEDGFGDSSESLIACLQPAGYVFNNTDCNDNDSQIHPNTTWYVDNDGDGFGVIIDPENPDLIYTSFGCVPVGDGNYVTNSSDCDDTNSAINPNTIWYEDNDNDGHGDPNLIHTNITCDLADLMVYVMVGDDCNDSDPTVFTEQNWYLDADADGTGDPNNAIFVCTPPAGYVLNSDDCDDADDQIKSIRWYEDLDGDGIGNTDVSIKACIQPDGFVLINGDCNDENAEVTEVTTWYLDADGDGYGTEGNLLLTEGEGGESFPYSTESCDQPFVMTLMGDTIFYVNNNLDCFENDPDRASVRHYRDQDGDGFGDVNDPGIGFEYNECNDAFNVPLPEGYSYHNSDADDSNPAINPETEWHIDTDGDGFGHFSIHSYTGNYPPENEFTYVMNNLDMCPFTYGKYSGCANLEVSLSDENYVFTRTFKEPVSYESYDPNVKVFTDDVVDYMDGLGRVYQRSHANQSPTFSDLVEIKKYDAAGREAVSYLPFTQKVNGALINEASIAQKDFYIDFKNDSSAFQLTKFIKGTEDLVSEIQGVGDAWKSTKRFTCFEYDFNGTDEVVLLSHLNLLNATKQFYLSNQLIKTATYDEDSLLMEEFTNALGQTVLKRSQVDTTTWAETYYIYDDFGNLTVVLPPEAISRLDGEFYPEDENGRKNFLNIWAFLYNYDHRNRMSMKKVPGADSVFMIYDKWDRLVLTQDGNQRRNDQWLFTQYDVLNRPILTGIAEDHDGNLVSTVENEENNRYEELDNSNPTTQYSERQGLNGYIVSYLTVTYYDNYAFQTHNDWIAADLGFTHLNGLPTPLDLIRGQVTGGMTRVEDGSWIRSVSYYDNKYRLIESQSTNKVGGKDVVSNYLDFIGQVDKAVSTHSEGSNMTTITRRFDYDHAGRLIATYHQINDSEEVVLSSNIYNEVGELIEKNLHAQALDGQAGFHQSLDYNYNIRGWMTDMNATSLADPQESYSDLFGMKLHYNKEDPSLNNQARYNGNISAMEWSEYAELGTIDNSYVFDYDQLSRLTHADYNQANASFDVSDLSYDLNGNILSLSRNGAGGQSIDILEYDYTADYANGEGGNRLRSVMDAANNAEGFDNGTSDTNEDYTYDANGNMVADLNKGIDSIQYNHLNLPIRVYMTTAEGSGRIEYLYDAAGIKLQQKVFKADTLFKTTDYAGEYIYEDGELQFIQHEEGRIVPLQEGHPELVSGSNEHDYQYHLKDHLGNVRVTFSTTPEEYVTVQNMESANNEGSTAESPTSFVNIPYRADGQANTTVGGDEVATLMAGNTGVMQLIRVGKKDKLALSVQANYENDPSSFDLASITAASIFNAYNVGAATGGVESLSSQVSSGMESAVAAMGNGTGSKSSEGEAPKAYLNFIYFDRDMNYHRAGFTQISTAARGIGSHEEVTLDAGTMEKDGFILVYLSNENTAEVPVNFDDLTIRHTVINDVVSSQDYYPFGGEFNSYSRTASTPNRYKYNGFELDDNTGLYDYLARQYDPWIGRFTSIDPAADLMRRHSPYNYAFDNPIRFIDPDGMMPTDVIGDDQFKEIETGDCCGGNPVAGQGEGIARAVENKINQVSDAISGALDAVAETVSDIFTSDQPGGVVVTSSSAGVDPTQATAGSVTEEIDADGATNVLGGSSKSSSTFGGIAKGLSKVKDLVNEFHEEGTSTDGTSNTNTSQSTSDGNSGSQTSTGNDRTFIERRPWFSVGSPRQGVDSTFQNSNGSLQTDRWLLRDATGGYTKTKIN